MADIALINQELADLRTERDELRGKHKGATMPEEARARDMEIVDRVKRLTFVLEEEQQKNRDRTMDETAKFLDDPHYQINRAVNDDDDGRRTMARAGWDIRAGTVYRQTARGEIAFCPEEVLFGPLPNDDPVAAKHFSQMRATLQPEYGVAFTKWLRNHGRMGALSGAEQNALSEGDAGDGGHLVPPDRQAEIMARRAGESVMRNIASVRQTSRNVYEIPAVTPNSSSGSIYSSGFVGGLVGERPTATDAGPTFQMFQIGVKKFQAYTKVTNDLLADAASDVMGFLAVDGGRNLALVEDNYFLNGVGTGLEPLGLLLGGSTTVDVEGTTSNEVSNTVSDAGSAPKIIGLAGTLPGQYARNGRWLMLRAVKFDILKLVDGDGRPWWQPAGAAGGAAAAPATLLDMPVSEHEFMPDGGTNANKVLVVGDFSNYIIADRTSLSVFIDDVTLRGSSDETAIYLRSRAGGGVWNTDAFRFGIV